MNYLFPGWLLLLLASVVLADNDSNAVNERIPVRKSEMEAHWKVDCASSWARVIELRVEAGVHDCIFPENLRRQLQLCAFIYQPPGENFMHAGPDYQSAIAGGEEGGKCENSLGGKK